MRIMKTSKIYIAAALALSLAACSEQADFTQADVVNAAIENGEAPVAFDTYMGDARTNTRAYLGDPAYTGGTIGNNTDNGKTELKKVGFGVFGYFSGATTFTSWSSWAAGTTESNKTPNFMYNEKLTWAAGKNNWDYSPVKYWPNGVDAANTPNDPSNTAKEKTTQQKLSFFAYAPYVSATTTAYTKGGSETLPSGLTDGSDGNLVTTSEAASKGIVAMSKNSAATDMWVKYVMGASAKESDVVDLLWGLRGQKTYQETDNDNNTIATLGTDYNVDLTKQIVNEKVRFLFKHALAKVGGATATATASDPQPKYSGLKVVVDVDANGTDNEGISKQTDYFTSDFDKARTLVTIKSVKIQDGASAAADDGTAVYGESLTSNLTTSGWFDIMAGKWDSEHVSSDGTARYSITADNAPTADPKEYKLNPAIMEPTTAPTSANVETDPGLGTFGTWKNVMNDAVTVVGVDKGAPQPVYGNEDVPGLLLIPGGSEQKLYVTVDYIVRTADTKLNWDASESRKNLNFTEVEQIITNEVKLSGLNPNKYYTLVMHLGLTSVKFEAVVADWSTTDTDEYDDDGNPIGGDENRKSVWLPSNVVSPKNYSVSASATETPLSVKISGLGASAAYTTAETGNATVADGSADANGEATLSVTMAANKTNQPAVSTVTVTYDTDKTKVITITQAADETFTASSTDISKDGTTTPGTITVGKKSVAITSVTAGTVAGLTIADFAANGDNYKSSSVTASSNDSGSPIEKEVTLTINSEYTYKVKVKQLGE